MTNYKTHNFSPIPKNTYRGMLAGDKFCTKCGLLVNKSNNILLTGGEFNNMLFSIQKELLSCNEQIIKNLLE